MNSRPAESPAESRPVPSEELPQNEAAKAGLPRLTPLQFLVLWLLFAGPMSGRSLREALEARGARLGKAAFSQMIRRMQDARLVRGDFVFAAAPGRSVRYGVYQARQKGLQAWRDARRFYAALEEPPGAETRLFDESIQQREHDEFVDEFVRLTTRYLDAKQNLAEREPLEDAGRGGGRPRKG